MAAVRAVTFDFWNTLVREVADELMPVRAELIATACASAGVKANRACFERLMRLAWKANREKWRVGELFGSVEAASLIVSELQIDGPLRKRLVAEVAVAMQFMCPASNLDLCGGVVEAIDALAARGIRMGVISDTGFTPGVVLRARLRELGLLDAFAGYSFSDEVGAYKPDVKIFQHALGYLECPAVNVVHIGDLIASDILGAQRSGFRSLRYSGCYDDPQADLTQPVLTSFENLMEMLDMIC